MGVSTCQRNNQRIQQNSDLFEFYGMMISGKHTGNQTRKKFIVTAAKSPLMFSPNTTEWSTAMGEYVYVDYSNLFIEAQRVSAVYNRQVGSIGEAMATKTIDYDYRIDFDQLYHFLAGVRPKQVKRIALFGSMSPETDWVWAMAENAGFEAITHQWNAANKEKRVDTSVITELLRDAYKHGTTKDVFKLVAGDGDFIPAVQRLVEDGYHVEVLFWDHASYDLKQACSGFTSLNKRLIWLAS